MKVDQGRVQFFAGGGKWICDNSVFTLVGWAGGLHEVQTYKNHPEDFLEHNLLKNPHFQRFWWRWGSGSGGWLGCNNSQGRKVFFTLFLVFHHILLFVLVIIVLWLVLIFFLLLHMLFPHWESETRQLHTNDLDADNRHAITSVLMQASKYSAVSGGSPGGRW